MILLHSLKFPTVVFCFIVITNELVGASLPTKRKKAKNVIDWNNSFYASNFEPCKKLRILNPVETVRAQAYAASLFRKCGPKMIVRLGSKYNFPAYGIVHFTRLLCVPLNLIYAYLADDGGVIIPESTQTSVIFGFVRKFLDAMRKANLTILLKNGRESFRITLSHMLDFANEAIPCAFDAEKVTQTDGDYLKHAINHFRVMLL